MNKNIRILLLAIFWCAIHNGFAQNTVVQAEYYIDSDPGPGSGIQIDISASDSISQNFNVDVTGLELGMHVLFIRARQSDGLWSIPQKRHFFVQDTSQRVVENIERNVYEAEYFIDTDPGVGNGTTISFSTADSVSQNFSLDVSGHSFGLHYLFLRVHQDDGLWSIAKRVPFFVADTVNDESIVFNKDIVAAEYFFDNDPGPGKGYELPVQKGDSINHRPWAASTAGLSVGKHFLYLRVKSEDGLWNTVVREEIFIFEASCIMPLVNFHYDTVPANTPVNLIDASSNVNSGASYEWDILGDGTIEGDSSSFEATFGTTGVYPVKLTVTNPDGCANSKINDIYVTDGFNTSLTLSANDTLFVGDTLILTAPVGFSYEWNNGSTENNIIVTEAGNYFVWLNKGNITYKSEQVNIQFFNPVQATLITLDEVNNLGNGSAILKDLNADGLPYSIQWSSGEQDITEVNNLSAGAYSVDITTSLETKTFNFTISNTVPGEGTITAAEYFINTDPGPGNGTALNISFASEISYKSEFLTTDLQEGVNKVFVRVKQANGFWSTPQYSLFYVTPPSGGNPAFSFGSDIVYAEYAIDTMPSLGSGIEVPLDSAGNSIDKIFAVDISGLSLGDHKIYVRARDAEGHWSFEEYFTFRICNEVPSNPVAPDLAICKGTNFTYALDTTGSTYNWYDENKELIKSSTDNYFSSNNVTDTLRYFVSQQNAEGCESALVPFQIQVSEPYVYAGNDMEISVYSDSILLNKTIPQGGSWTSEGDYLSTSGVFYPAYAGVGTFEFTFKYDTLNCTSTDILKVNVTSEEIDTIKVVISGSDWKANSGEVAGWTEAGFNDTNWQNAASPSPYHYISEYFPENAPTMWSQEDVATVYLRKEFPIQDSVTVMSAIAKIYADDDHELYINGSLVHTDMDSESEFTINVKNYLKRGQDNVIAIKAIDNGSYAGVGFYMRANLINGIADNPDFTISAGDIVSTYYRKYDLFDVSTTVQNIGNLSADSAYSIDYYISSDSLFDLGDLHINTLSGDSIAAGDEVLLSFSFMLPDTTSAGNYYLIAVTDPDNIFQEENEENNNYVVLFTVVENQPPALADKEFTVDENSPNGSVIGNLSATDPENDMLFYNILSGNESNAWSIDSAGSVLIADSSMVDFELDSAFNLLVIVSDAIDSASATINIFINDLEELDPVERDSLALVALYNASDGANWSYETENAWLQGNIDTWEGVTSDNGRVISVVLVNKGLKGDIPIEITNMDSLRIFDVHDNEIEGLPNLSSLQKLEELNVSSNNLTFEDLESNMEIPNFTYSPQATIGEYDYVLLPVHTDTTLTSVVGGTANHYQWYFNSNPVGTDNPAHIITDIKRDNMGAYFVEVTNDLVPGLTISTIQDDIYAGADISGSITNGSAEVITSGVEVILLAIREIGGYDTLGIIPVSNDGSYMFEQKLLQDYMVIASNDTLVHPNLLPTYFQEAIFWEEADTLFLETNVSGIDVQMVEYVEESLGGEGVISGYIEELIEDAAGKLEARKRVKNASVSIRRRGNANRQKIVENSRMLDELELVATNKSDEDGKFAFQELVDDVYLLNIQYPGYPMDESSFVEIPIGDAGNSRIVAHTDNVEVEALVAEGKITVTQINVTHIYRDELYKGIVVYPNPTKGDLSIQLGDKSAHVEVKLYDASQREVMAKEINSGEINMNVDHLDAGIYILMLNIEAKVIATYKIVIEH